MAAPVDIVQMDLVRRQGDVSGTLIQIAPNGQPANIGGWTFVFSVQPGATLLPVTWTPPVGNAGGLQMTTVDVPGFNIPSFNSTVNINVINSTGINAGDYLFIQGFGVCQVKVVFSQTNLTLYNSSFSINSFSGSIPATTPIFQASNMGYTVLVIPASITDWNSTAALTPTRSMGRFQYYLKYDTTDPAPGPFKKTFYQGNLYIQPQNDPAA